MAGSMKWFRYVADDGQAYAIFRDESSTELINLAADYNAAIPTQALPKNLKVRTASFLGQGNDATRRQYTILTAARWAALVGTTAVVLGDYDIDSGITMTISSKKGEQFTRIPRTFDTGKTDGDNP